jgi:hypothetical protein
MARQATTRLVTPPRPAYPARAVQSDRAKPEFITEEPIMTRRFTAAPVARAIVVGLALALLPLSTSLAKNDKHEDESAGKGSESEIQRGFDIAPVRLSLKGKNRALVGLGSYIVNTGGCNDCHTNPSYAPGGDPFKGEPEQINTAGYLAGGTPFGPFISANLTPDANGLPAGLTRDEFIALMRTGHDPDAPAGQLLQVMPWPVFAKKTDRDLKAIYEYLRSIPSIQ